MSYINTVGTTPSAQNDPAGGGDAPTKRVTFVGLDLNDRGVRPGWWFKYTGEDAHYQVEEVDPAGLIMWTVEDIPVLHAALSAFEMGSAHTPYKKLRLPGPADRNPDMTLREAIDVIDGLLGGAASQTATLSRKTGVVNQTLIGLGAGAGNAVEVEDDSGDATGFRTTVTTDADASANWIDLYADILVKNVISPVADDEIWAVLEQDIDGGGFTEVNRYPALHEPFDGSNEWTVAKVIEDGEWGRIRIAFVLDSLTNAAVYTFRIRLFYVTSVSKDLLIESSAAEGTRLFTAILHHQ